MNNELLLHAKKYYHYDKNTGLVTYKKLPKNFKRKRIGDVVGSISHGYIRTEINNKTYAMHNIVWLIHYGHFPNQVIDHINGNKSDNRIENLRDCSRRDNSNNLEMHRLGHLPGTSFSKQHKKWASYINFKNKKIHLKLCKTQKEAHELYLKSKQIIENRGNKCQSLLIKEIMDLRQIIL